MYGNYYSYLFPLVVPANCICSKPRNARSKRIQEKKAPKVVENPKSALFLRGTSCSQVVQDALADIYSMRQPLAKKYACLPATSADVLSTCAD